MQADYVIVGAGSAGCVLANRLTEDPGTRVVLIEAGGRDRNPLISALGAPLAVAGSLCRLPTRARQPGASKGATTSFTAPAY